MPGIPSLGELLNAAQNVDSPFWEDDAFLTPVVPEDPLLYTLGGVLEDGPGEPAAAVATPEATPDPALYVVGTGLRPA